MGLLVQAERMNIAVAAISVASDLFMVVGMSVYEGKVMLKLWVEKGV